MESSIARPAPSVAGSRLPLPPPPPGTPATVPPRPDVAPLKHRRMAVALAIVGAFVLIVAVVAATGGALGRSETTTYRFLTLRPDGTPYRWDPCTPIHYVVDEAPPGAMPTIREAVERVSDATGITFVYDGPAERTTDTYYRMQFERPFVLGESRSWEPVLIDRIDTEHFTRLAQTDLAAAFATPWSPKGDLDGTYVSGLVAVDEGLPIPLGFGARASLGIVLMHELGHVMGLDHVPDGDQLMWSPDVADADALPDLGQTDWGSGDLAGLRALGRQEEACPAAG